LRTPTDRRGREPEVEDTHRPPVAAASRKFKEVQDTHRPSVSAAVR